jgi:hypothetical protein
MKPSQPSIGAMWIVRAAAQERFGAWQAVDGGLLRSHIVNIVI